MAKGGGIVGIPPPEVENLAKYPPPPGVGSKDPPLGFWPRFARPKFIKNHAKLQENGGKLVNLVIFHQK